MAGARENLSKIGALRNLCADDMPVRQRRTFPLHVLHLVLENAPCPMTPFGRAMIHATRILLISGLLEHLDFARFGSYAFQIHVLPNCPRRLI